jgi:hypothetical protein
MKDLKRASGQDLPDRREAAIFAGISSAAKIAVEQTKETWCGVLH